MLLAAQGAPGAVVLEIQRSQAVERLRQSRLALVTREAEQHQQLARSVEVPVEGPLEPVSRSTQARALDALVERGHQILLVGALSPIVVVATAGRTAQIQLVPMARRREAEDTEAVGARRLTRVAMAQTAQSSLDFRQ